MPSLVVELKGKDEVTEAIENTVRNTKEPLETKEIHEKIQHSLGDVSRSKLLYRLNNLRAEGVIGGKFIGSGKGVWVWWRKKVRK